MAKTKPDFSHVTSTAQTVQPKVRDMGTHLGVDHGAPHEEIMGAINQKYPAPGVVENGIGDIVDSAGAKVNRAIIQPIGRAIGNASNQLSNGTMFVRAEPEITEDYMDDHPEAFRPRSPMEQIKSTR